MKTTYKTILLMELMRSGNESRRRHFYFKTCKRESRKTTFDYKKCAWKKGHQTIYVYIYLLMVGYGCYRTGHSACGLSSTSWSLREHIWCGCEEVVPQWMIFPTNGCPNDS